MASASIPNEFLQLFGFQDKSFAWNNALNLLGNLTNRLSGDSRYMPFFDKSLCIKVLVLGFLQVVRNVKFVLRSHCSFETKWVCFILLDRRTMSDQIINISFGKLHLYLPIRGQRKIGKDFPPPSCFGFNSLIIFSELIPFVGTILPVSSLWEISKSGKNSVATFADQAII